MSAEKMIPKHAGKIKASDHAYFAIHNCNPQLADDVIDQIVAFVRASGMETIRRPVVKKDKFAQNTEVVMSIHVVLRNHADRQTAIHFVEHHLNQKYGMNMRCKEMGRDIVTYTLSLQTTELPEMAELKRHFDEFGRNEIFCTSELITYINYRFFRSAVDAMLAFSSNGSQSEVLPSHPKPVQYTRMMLDLENQLTQNSFGATSDAVETSSSFAAFVEAYHHDTPVRLKQACEKFVRDYFADTQPTDQFLNANATSIISSVLQEPYPTLPAEFRDCIQQETLSTSNIAQLHRKYNVNGLDKSVRLVERTGALKDSASSKIFEFKAPPVPVRPAIHGHQEHQNIHPSIRLLIPCIYDCIQVECSNP